MNQPDFSTIIFKALETGRRLDQKDIRQHWAEEIRWARVTGKPREEIVDFLRQCNGGNCPHCGRPYRKVQASNELFCYEFFCPDCDCAEKLPRGGEPEMETQGRLIRTGVPERYRSVSFPTWDTKVDPRATKAMRTVWDYVRTKEYRKTGLVLYGGVGTGKTRCMACVAREIGHEYPNALWISMSKLVDDFAGWSGAKVLDDLGRVPLLFIDDLDKNAMDADKPQQQQRFYRLFDDMWTRKAILVTTTNLANHEEFLERLGDVITSRLIDMCRFVHFQGSDYRNRPTQERSNS